MRPTGLLVIVLAASPWSGLAAQRASEAAARAEVYAGSELETYLRNLQVVGAVPAYPWSARRFTAAEVDRLLPSDSAHPWELRYDWRPAPERELSVAVARPEVATRLNSGFPYGYNDGAVWAGRGITLSVQGGFQARYGPLAATVAPLAAWASNSGFRLQPNGIPGASEYADDRDTGWIDHPQRFGGGPYALVSGGQSVVEVVKWGAVAGVSSANDYWGPATEFPMVLGDNAGGFPHAFAGTATPVDLGIVRLQLRTLFGRLTQSAWSPQTGDPSVRAASAAVVVAMPRWPEGLELGATHFIHRRWSRRGWLLEELLAPFSLRHRPSDTYFTGTTNDSLENRQASVFFRWVFVPAGIEVYGEYGTEDWRHNLREALVEPDHNAGYTLGLRRVTRPAPGRLRVLRAEVQDLRRGTLVQDGFFRAVQGFYGHVGLRAGHTYEGQVLGSDPGLGGAAARIAVDWYHPGGRWTVGWSRLLIREIGGASVAAKPQDPRGLDVQHTLGVEAVAFRGRYDIWAGATAVYEFNRNFRGDAFNLNLFFAVRTGLR